ncbi:PA2779 family protein [Rivibacter subsaxonicus]|uniref:PA2779 family protein n=1 Tax=Rivibacter subsaxonicus TaxID=457575 RepID=A0A4Q7W230_9BURK|nr:PA2779 family protein [Rivibacter subsaxonicus]RZU03153.1 hypothetical protein EV670_1186 [Rivibacter subsaxonicus]
MNKFRRAFLTLLMASLSYAGMLQSAHAALIGTEAVAAAQAQVAPVDAADARTKVLAQLDRPELVQALAERGVDIEAARARVAGLGDADVQQLAQMIDSAPAGASADILGVLVFIFVLLLVTDILGLTKVFPFTRSVR